MSESMKICNPFKRKETVAELIEKIRPIVSKYGFPEAYVSYDELKDIHVDKPEWVMLTFPICPGDTAQKHNAFRHEIHATCGDRVAPYAAHPDDENMEYARSHYVSVFS